MRIDPDFNYGRLSKQAIILWHLQYQTKNFQIWGFLNETPKIKRKTRKS